jgi:hypothetical protein
MAAAIVRDGRDRADASRASSQGEAAPAPAADTDSLSDEAASVAGLWLELMPSDRRRIYADIKRCAGVP